MTDTWKMRTAHRSMSIDNINFLSSPSSTLMKPSNSQQHEMTDDTQQYYNDDSEHKQKTDYDSPNENRKEDEDDNIIPWKKLLRKTNSRLNLIS